MAPPWTNTWNETSPADSDAANTLGSTGRQLRLDIRQRLDWQHVWNVDVNHDGGHRFVAIESAYHPANTASFAAAGFSLTGSNAQSCIDIAGTWNTSGTPTGIKLNILDNGSNASSLLMDLQVGGVSKFKVDKAGNLTLAGTGSGNKFTTWTTVAANATVSSDTGVLQASTDLFFVGQLSANSGTPALVSISMGPSNPPSGQTMEVSAFSSGAFTGFASFTWLVRKGDYYRIIYTAASSILTYYSLTSQ